MTLEVLRTGPLATVQDLGRVGHASRGVPPSGAMDPFALQTANLLVGNGRGAAAIEIALGGFAVRAIRDCIVALTGADLGAETGGESAPRWESFLFEEGREISFAGRRSGVWAYLAIAGGIAVPEVMGSRSTFTRGRFGGLEGRALSPGDRLEPGACPSLPPVGTRFPLAEIPSYLREARVRVVLGPDEDRFEEEALGVFLSSAYEVTARSDRMGYRLRGPALRHRGAADVLTDAVALGSVQVPSDGQPIVLGPDRPTTGGYAKIATVISADFPAVAQVPVGGTLSFRAVSVEEAQLSNHTRPGWSELRRRDPPTAEDPPPCPSARARAPGSPRRCASRGRNRCT